MLERGNTLNVGYKGVMRAEDEEPEMRSTGLSLSAACEVSGGS